LVNVFTRKTWVEVVPNKTADAVLTAAKVPIERLETKPKVLSTDDGGEYSLLSAWLLEKAIAHKTHVSDRDVNSIAVLDRCVQDIKQRLSRILARTRKGDEKIKLTQAIQAHNNSINAIIHGTPNEVGKNPDLVFMNLVDNAAKFEHNKKVLQHRTTKLQAAGAFRQPLPGVTKNPFLRSFEARYGPPENVEDIKGSTVVGQDGTKIDIKLVKAVAVGTSGTHDIEQEKAKTEQKRANLYPMMEALHEWMGDREVSTKAATMHLRKTGAWQLDDKQLTYAELLNSQGFRSGAVQTLGQFAEVVRLFPLLFTLTRGGIYMKKA
jgi:hypothetical protein